MFDMIQYFPGNMYNGCPYYYNALTFNIYNPKIVPSVI